MGIGAIVKFVVDGLVAIQSVFTVKIEALKTEFSAEVYPALVSVGYICDLESGRRCSPATPLQSYVL